MCVYVMLILRSIIVVGHDPFTKNKRFMVVGLKPTMTTNVKTNITPAYVI